MQTPTRPVAARVPLGRVPGALLVADQDVPDLRESNSGSYAGRIAPPGMPKTTSTPGVPPATATRLWAPVICSLIGGSSSGRVVWSGSGHEKAPRPTKGDRRGCAPAWRLQPARSTSTTMPVRMDAPQSRTALRAPRQAGETRRLAMSRSPVVLLSRRRRRARPSPTSLAYLASTPAGVARRERASSLGPRARARPRRPAGRGCGRRCRRRIRSPSRTKAIGPPSTASGATCPMHSPVVPPENRPSVISRTSLPSPAPLIARGDRQHLAHARARPWGPRSG